MNKPLDEETRARNAGECKSCHAPIVWAKTPKGKPMPMDPDLVHGGNVKLTVDDVGMLRAEVVRPIGNVEAWVTHFSVCESADEHRKEEKPEGRSHEEQKVDAAKAGRVVMPFGKYAGEYLDDVVSSPRGRQYLRWAYSKLERLDPTLKASMAAVLGEDT